MAHPLVGAAGQAATGAEAGQRRGRHRPVRDLGQAPQHRRQARFRDMGQAEGQRVGAGGDRRLVDGGFHRQSVRPGAQAAPGTGEDRQPDQVVGDVAAGDPVGRRCTARDPAIADEGVGQRLQPGRHGGVGEQDMAADQAVLPVGQSLLACAAVAEPQPQPVADRRAVEALRIFLRPGPAHLDRPAGRLRQGRGLRLHGADGAGTEGTACAGRMHGDPVRRQPQAAGQHVADVERILGAGPDRHPAVRRYGERRPGFDPAMGCGRHVEPQVDMPAPVAGDAVVRQAVARFGINSIDVDRRGDLRRLLCVDLPFGVEGFGNAVQGARRLGDDAQALAGAEPEHAGFRHGDEARHRPRRLQVPGGRPGAGFRRDRGAEHPAMGHVRCGHVGGEQRPAGDDVAQPVRFGAAADEAAAAEGAQCGPGPDLGDQVAGRRAAGQRVAQGGAGLRQRLGEAVAAALLAECRPNAVARLQRRGRRRILQNAGLEAIERGG